MGCRLTVHYTRVDPIQDKIMISAHKIQNSVNKKVLTFECVNISQKKELLYIHLLSAFTLPTERKYVGIG